MLWQASGSILDLFKLLVHPCIADIDRGALERGISLDRKTRETASGFIHLHVRDDQPAFAILSCSCGTAKTMDVCLAISGEMNLNDMGDVGEVHASCCYIR